jgi:hypothetical protein
MRGQFKAILRGLFEWNFHHTLENSKNNLQINANDLNNGVYLYQIMINGNVVSADKLIIIK